MSTFNIGTINNNQGAVVNYGDVYNYSETPHKDIQNIILKSSELLEKESVMTSLDFIKNNLNTPIEPKNAKEELLPLAEGSASLKKMLYDFAMNINSNIAATWLLTYLPTILHG